MKVYEVVYSKTKADEDEDILIIKIFLNREIALNYLKRQIKETKEEFKETKDYEIKETENSYERTINGRALQDSIYIWLDEEELSDEYELLMERQRLQNEKETDYEM